VVSREANGRSRRQTVFKEIKSLQDKVSRLRNINSCYCDRKLGELPA